MKESSYAEMKEVPPFVRYVASGNMKDKPVDDVKWSGDSAAPPAIGSEVYVKMNAIGWARVVCYFVQDGWLGVKVQPHDPPEWYIKQNGGNCECHAFGAELGEAPAAKKGAA